jgi:predicted AAA+ superfamily ATPase
MNDKFDVLVERLHALMDRVELVLPRPLSAPDWTASVAFRYRKRASGHGALEPVAHVAPLRLDDLKEIDNNTPSSLCKVCRPTTCCSLGLGARENPP